MMDEGLIFFRIFPVFFYSLARLFSTIFVCRSNQLDFLYVSYAVENQAWQRLRIESPVWDGQRIGHSLFSIGNERKIYILFGVNADKQFCNDLLSYDVGMLYFPNFLLASYVLFVSMIYFCFLLFASSKSE